MGITDENPADIPSRLAADVVPRFRTRGELFRYGRVREYAEDARLGIDELRAAADAAGALAVLPSVQKAITAAIGTVLRADDSSGLIGDLISELLDLHAELAVAEPPPTAALVRWMIRFQFDGRQDFFELDVARYAPALGEKGVAAYRAELDRIEAGLGPEPDPEAEQEAFRNRFTDEDAYRRISDAGRARSVLAHNRRRLAVLERDVEEVIALHGGDFSMPYRFREVSEALGEIGETDPAIEWARLGMLEDDSHQAEECGRHWCAVLERHRPAEVPGARSVVFERWPSGRNIAALRDAAGPHWPAMEEEALGILARRPHDYVGYLVGTNVRRAWAEAGRLGIADPALWTRLAAAYQTVDPAAVVPVLRRLVEEDLSVADAANYVSAVRRLRQMRPLCLGLGRAEEFRDYVASLREENRRRPRFLSELDRGLGGLA